MCCLRQRLQQLKGSPCLCTEPVRAARPTEVLGAEGIFMREEQEAGTVVHRELLKVTLRIVRAAR